MISASFLYLQATEMFRNTIYSNGYDYAFFALCLNKRLSKQSWGWWSERPSHSWWRHCDVFWLPCVYPSRHSLHIDLFSAMSSPMILSFEAKDSNNRARVWKQLVTDFGFTNTESCDIPPVGSLIVIVSAIVGFRSVSNMKTYDVQMGKLPTPHWSLKISTTKIPSGICNINTNNTT